MSWTNFSQSTRTLIYAVAVISLAAFGLWIGVNNNKVEANTTAANLVPAATFAANAGSLGAIADGGSTCSPSPGAARDVTFTVAGVNGSVSAVDVGMTFGSPNHTFIGDIVAVLIAPNGASHNVFGRTLATTATSFGDASDLGGTYTFSDTAAAPPSGGWWQEANIRGTAEVMTSGTYRTTASGGAGATIPMPPTTMNTSFTGVTNANGTWTLRITDGCSGDTGAVTAATLSVTGAAAPLDANADFNGDGKTDYTVARGTSTPFAEVPNSLGISKMARNQEVKGRPRSAGKSDNLFAPPIYWYVSLNGPGTTGVAQLGDAATDFITPEDFDGDGKDDLAVWTEAAATVANFKILQSSNNTVRVETFGQTGDDPAVVGDYDGDGKADPAVYRCPPFTDPDGQCYFFYRGSLNNPSGAVTYVPWGFGVDGDFFPYVGDFDGDGKNDFCVQRADPVTPAQGQFVLLKSNGLGVEYISWGKSSDFLIPGDYDGDGKTDLCVRRSNDPTTGLRTYYLLTRTGATSQIQWGITGDVSVPGDYDGDGKIDAAVFRPSNGVWYINGSTAGFRAFQWGLAGDIPVQADYDGDGKTDIAVFRAGVWYVFNSTQGYTGAFTLGTALDRPVPADYDGDLKADPAVFNNGSWTINRSSLGPTAFQFGVAADVPVPGDYNGDGLDNPAVFRPSNGTWYISKPTGGYDAQPFGLSTDKLIPADYDGDGRTDIAVWRANTTSGRGEWYILQSRDGFTVANFGFSTDTPVANSLIH
ncbi:MAG: VCBS repeat-containing protein [Acidobacteria bacterium]|nr:VCBS repeat-containing protein [Acidobacteriota bacterium]